MAADSTPKLAADGSLVGATDSATGGSSADHGSSGSCTGELLWNGICLPPSGPNTELNRTVVVPDASTANCHQLYFRARSVDDFLAQHSVVCEPSTTLPRMTNTTRCRGNRGLGARLYPILRWLCLAFSGGALESRQAALRALLQVWRLVLCRVLERCQQLDKAETAREQLSRVQGAAAS